MNEFSNEEAIEICIALRDQVISSNMETKTDLTEIWREPDALAQVINLARELIKEKQSE